jgi:hypothetical protein
VVFVEAEEGSRERESEGGGELSRDAKESAEFGERGGGAGYTANPQSPHWRVK